MVMGNQRGHHCVYNIHYHFVFAVKYRYALIDPAVETELGRLSQEVAERYEIETECLGADRNHIHWLCSAHPKYGPGDIARIYKSITARELFVSLPGLKKSLWGGEFWSDGYYVETVAERGSWSALVRYIEQQGEKVEDVHLRLLPLPPLDRPDW